MLIMIVQFAYLPPIFFLNFSVPTDNVQMPKINDRVNVNKTPFNPNIKPDSIVIVVNAAIVLD